MKNEPIRATSEYGISCEKQRGASYEWQEKTDFAILRVEEGEANLSTRGRRYRVIPGDAVILTDGTETTLTAAGNEIKTSVIPFSSRLISENMRRALFKAAPIVRSPRLAAVIAEAEQRIAAELKVADAITRDMCRAYAAELCAAIVRSENDFKDEIHSSSAVSTVIAYVAEHFSERISLSDMARLCKVSPPYLSRRFKAEVGMGFADYVATYRLGRAETMLREMDEMSVTEIAFLCGFNDSNYFSDKFKKHFGVSPLKFRKQEE